jgi:hypothetical protein
MKTKGTKNDHKNTRKLALKKGVKNIGNVYKIMKIRGTSDYQRMKNSTKVERIFSDPCQVTVNYINNKRTEK